MVTRIGLIGCGNISDIYLLNAARFPGIAFSACADLRPAAAAAKAETYGIEARSVDALLASDDVDIVLNLTVPAAHAEVSLAALESGKHVYSEKPLATSVADGEAILAAAAARQLRVGAAPDTVLGAAIQEARRQIDAGVIGKPLVGVASVLSHGMENWHPDPTFFFKPGGGPVLDMGPYYLSTLVNLLGPVHSVQASGQIGFENRIVTTPHSPILGQEIRVEVLSTVQALLEFDSGAQVTFLASWDVWKHGLRPLELHGTAGSLRVPDPNWFGGVVETAVERGDWAARPTTDRVFGASNWPAADPVHANYRGAGIAEMAQAIEQGRPHRANGEVALHVLAVMAGILEAADSGARVTIGPRCTRPDALSEAEALTLTGGTRDGLAAQPSLPFAEQDA
ncbi:Gfo/Idh/MocA family protein [Aurantimonas endophytica]|uniref:Putative dehydrogenase n=1 Tax=Aurantimonas endophytica TaxID=1522175 RepID=A0A7W6HFN1_9HYPH|nr:Gfo/Idh/MocA family oxidoreductase [Aurantimonas endophytica]MBB4004364.1 putative dehydrogenase [Aurantimonas endophytica]MCO6405203.1 Gfo/Idh/MocA family oxidoreductase [Aurantimonas endophytica]